MHCYFHKGPYIKYVGGGGGGGGGGAGGFCGDQEIFWAYIDGPWNNFQNF